MSGCRRPQQLLSVVLAALVLLAGCSWGNEAPGLFGRPTEPPTAAPLPQPSSSTSRPPEPGNPDLPVVGEAVWTSAEGRDVKVRLAVHALRRIRGATILDWSITPLSAANRQTGDLVPPSVNLGLGRIGEGTANIFLLVGGEVYRPLIRRTDQSSSCLCTPLGTLQTNLRIGVTTLAQIAFPPLPADTALVDVDITTVPVFTRVPVTPMGMVPLVVNPTDLTRADERSAPVAISEPFQYAPARQQFVIVVDQVLTSSTLTSLAWRVRTLDTGQGLDTATEPPITDASPPPVPYNLGSAGGPQLRVRGGDRELLPVRLLTTKGSPRGGLECLCSDLRLWTNSMRAADSEAMVVTNFGALPRRIRTVDVVLPGVTTLSDLPVATAPYAANQSSGPVQRRVGAWSAGPLPGGWPAQEWPTPVPSAQLVSEFAPMIDDLVR